MAVKCAAFELPETRAPQNPDGPLLRSTTMCRERAYSLISSMCSPGMRHEWNMRRYCSMLSGLPIIVSGGSVWLESRWWNASTPAVNTAALCACESTFA